MRAISFCILREHVSSSNFNRWKRVYAVFVFEATFSKRSGVILWKKKQQLGEEFLEPYNYCRSVWDEAEKVAMETKIPFIYGLKHNMHMHKISDVELLALMSTSA